MVDNVFGMTPFGAGAASGPSVAVPVDEVADRLRSIAPPLKTYPLVRRPGALKGHVVYALGVAAPVDAPCTVSGHQ